MKLFKLASATLAVAALLASASAQAQPRGGGPPGGPGGPPAPQGDRGQALGDYLGLTDAQKAAAEALRETLHATVEPLVEQERTLRDAIHDALEAGSRDAAALGTLMLQAHDVRQQIKAAHDAFDASFAALLTAEQKAKWDCARAAREAMGGPGGPGGPGGGPGRMRRGR